MLNQLLNIFEIIRNIDFFEYLFRLQRRIYLKNQRENILHNVTSTYPLFITTSWRDELWKLWLDSKNEGGTSATGELFKITTDTYARIVVIDFAAIVDGAWIAF